MNLRLIWEVGDGEERANRDVCEEDDEFECEVRCGKLLRKRDCSEDSPEIGRSKAWGTVRDHLPPEFRSILSFRILSSSFFFASSRFRHHPAVHFLRKLMLEADEVCPQGLVSPCALEDSCEEELSVLPRHTKVIVTGNNRTKSVLLGLHGVVKKAVGLGGWHWLVLTNGLEVKLQRNALSVLEAPTGLEEDENDSEELFSSRSNVEDFSKSFKPRIRVQKSTPKSTNKNQVADTSSTGSKTGPELLKVNLGKLETTALLRYWRRFNLAEAVPNPSKEQLVDAVERHFNSQKLDELQVIARFVQAAKRLKTVYG